MNHVARMQILGRLQQLVHDVPLVNVFQDVAAFDHVVKVSVCRRTNTPSAGLDRSYNKGFYIMEYPACDIYRCAYAVRATSYAGPGFSYMLASRNFVQLSRYEIGQLA